MSDPTRPFWLDWDYDRANADTGTRSRYGNYLYQRARSFTEISSDDPSVEFALTAWRIATGPILAPPLVCNHPRVLDVDLQRSGWDGEALAHVRLVAPRPRTLAHATPVDGDYYRDYTLSSWTDEYEGISEEDLTRSAYLLTEVRLLWQLPVGKLPTIKEIPTGSEAIFRQAVECLDGLVWALNREVGPVIEQLAQA